MEYLALSLGLVLTLLVTAQLGLVTLSSLARFAREKRQDRLGDLLLLERIEAAAKKGELFEQNKLAWHGYRKFVVERKEEECEGICSFYLVPHDGHKIPSYLPGQYLEFRLKIPGVDHDVIRCYSLSDRSHSNYYRVTIKLVRGESQDPTAPSGSAPLSSTFFHHHVSVGDILDVKAPSGNFVLRENRRPAVFIAGGVGITPMYAMVRHALANEGPGKERQLIFVCGMRTGREHPWKDYIQSLPKKHPNLQVVTIYSDPQPDEAEGDDYDHYGRVSVDLLKPYLAREHHETGELNVTNNFEFYICGPPAMMSALSSQLRAWNVPKEDIFSEAFGPASVGNVQSKPGAKIKFSKAKQEIVWDGKSPSILAIAQKNGLQLPHACCVGKCGQCQVALRSGKVDYGEEQPSWSIEEGCCLTCVGRPDGDVEIDF